MLVSLRGFQRCSRPSTQLHPQLLDLERRHVYRGENRYGFAIGAKRCYSTSQSPRTQGLTLFSHSLLIDQRRVGKAVAGSQHGETGTVKASSQETSQESTQEGQHASEYGDNLIDENVEDATPKNLTSPLSRLAYSLFEEYNQGKKSSGPKFVSLTSRPRQHDIVITQSKKDQSIEDSELQKGTDTSLSDNAADLDIHCLSWSSRFQRMVSGHGLSLYVLQQESLEAIVSRYADSTKPITSIQDAWLKFPVHLDYSPIRLWQDLMLWCLENAPMRALKLLLATSRGIGFNPPRYMVADCLEQLAANLLAKNKEPDPWTIKAIRILLYRYMAKGDSTSNRSVQVPDHVAYSLLKHSDEDEAQNLLRMFITNNASLHSNTLLHFLDRSIQWGTLSLSMRLLQSIVNSRYNASKAQVQAACIQLARARLKGKQQYQVRIKTVTQIFEMGIKPQIALYNAILLNAIEAEDFETAWQLHAVAKSNGLTPDEVTYCTLLKGATVIQDPHVYEKLIDEILEARVVLQRSRRLISDLLHFLIKKMHYSRHEEFPRLLDIYKQYCNLTPLHELGICKPNVATADDRISKVQWPSSPILMHMICSYVKKHRTSDNLINVYNRYRELVKKRHPLFSPLPQWDYVPNAFVMAFGTRRETLKHCTTVIKDMLDSQHTKQESKESASVATASRSDKLSLPVLELKSSFPRRSLLPETVDIPSSTSGNVYDSKPPSVITWSILLHAYFRHDQRFAAEKVLSLMKERGLRRDRVTWNTMIGGYAKMQDVDATVGALQGMRVRGYVANVITLKNLSRLWDRRRLVKALKETAVPKSPKQAEDNAPMTEVEKRREEEGERFLHHFKIASASPNSSAANLIEYTSKQSKESELDIPADEVDEAIFSNDIQAGVYDADKSFDIPSRDVASDDEEQSTPDVVEEQNSLPGASSSREVHQEGSGMPRANITSQGPRDKPGVPHLPAELTGMQDLSKELQIP